MLRNDKHVFIALLGFLASGVALSGCKSQDAALPPQPPPEVAVVVVSPEPVALTTELPGRTAAYLEAEVRPQVNGIVQSRRFEEGQDVQAGDVLYQIEPAPYQAAYEQAQAALAIAEANLPALRARMERYKNALNERAVSKQDYDDAVAALNVGKATIEARRAELERARIELSYTPITAPISGRIGKSNITPGALVTAYQPVPLATIHQFDPIYVDVTQSTVELLRLRRNLAAGRLSTDSGNQKKVRLILEDGNPYPLEGTLQFRDIKVDPTTGSFTLRIVVPNPEYLLLPGMFVRAVISEGIVEEAILVPQQGVSRNSKGEAIALIVDDQDTVQQRKLTLNRALGDKWLVASGLSTGDRLIVEGLLNARPGGVVRTVSFKSPKADEKPAAVSGPMAKSQ